MATRTVGTSGFRLTVDIPDRLIRPLRRMRRRPALNAGRGEPEVSAGIRFGPTPKVSVIERDADRGLAFIRDRIERRKASIATDSDRHQKDVDGHPWYHTIDLGDGVVTPGYFDHRALVDRYGIPEDLSGRRVLDVGTADGFWAFEFERRGGDVTAVDIDSTAEVDLPPGLRALAADSGLVDPLGTGFALAHDRLGSRVRRSSGSVYTLDPGSLGTFDLVHAGDLLLHLRDPLLALARLRSVTRGEALLCDVFDPALSSSGMGTNQAVRYLGGWATAGWWLPALGTLVQMVSDAGFASVEVVTTYTLPARGSRTGPWRAVLRARP